MTLSRIPATMTGWALAAVLTIAAGTASAAAAPAEPPAMSTARSTAGVTIEPAGYHRPYRPYYGPRYRAPRYGYPYYYRGYYYPRVWWGAPAYVPPPVVAPAGRCARWASACAANWGYGNRDYYGCLRYHGC